MNHLTSEQLNELRRMLEQEKADLERRFDANDNFGLESSISEWTELSAYDNHPADIGTEMYEREKDIALNEHAENQLEQVNEALDRFKKVQYGNCVFCDKPIPYERLKTIPTTLYCIEHVPDPHISNNRPVEEQFLAPPFGRTSLDELDEQIQFDGEDAWQIVESWGTSDTPAMSENRDVEDYNEMYIEPDDEGFVEPLESFLATDIYGGNVTVVRNYKYKEYLANNEGDPLLEPDHAYDLDDGDIR